MIDTPEKNKKNDVVESSEAQSEKTESHTVQPNSDQKENIDPTGTIDANGGMDESLTESVNLKEENATESSEAVRADIGLQLKQSRESLEFSVADIAGQLNLATEIISAIENNQFEQTLPMAFIRGYVKSYASKLGLDAKTILNDFDKQVGQSTPSLASVKPISSFGKNRKEVTTNSFVFKGVTTLVVVAFVSYGGIKVWNSFLSGYFNGPNLDDNVGVVQLNANIQSADNEENVFELETNKNKVNAVETNSNVLNSSKVDPDTQNAEEKNSATNSTISSQTNIDLIAGKPLSDIGLNAVKNSESETGESSAFEQENLSNANSVNEAASPKVLGPSESLILDFTAACWVKITDATGEVLAIGTKQNGKHMPLRVVAPVSIILGDPAAVSMSYKNSRYDLSKYRAGRTANFTLE